MKQVLVILGSVRAGRLGGQIGAWLVEQLAHLGLGLELVDLKDWPLPADDEPDHPKAGNGYKMPHSRAWSAKIAAADGFVFLTPQYNSGYPGTLKIALDHLYHEWGGKPAVIVSYGNRGGGRAAAQLKDVLGGLQMRLAAPMPELPLKDAARDEAGRLADPSSAFAAQVPAILAAARDLAAQLEGGSTASAAR